MTWWKRIVTLEQKRNWKMLQSSLLKHFKPADQQSQALAKFVQRQQLLTESVNTYMSAQLELFEKAKVDSEEMKRTFFIHGLKPYINKVMNELNNTENMSYDEAVHEGLD